jgi:hypothetical protein
MRTYDRVEYFIGKSDSDRDANFAFANAREVEHRNARNPTNNLGQRWASILNEVYQLGVETAPLQPVSVTKSGWKVLLNKRRF